MLEDGGRRGEVRQQGKGDRSGVGLRNSANEASITPQIAQL